jgi:hypothetical protein
MLSHPDFKSVTKEFFNRNKPLPIGRSKRKLESAAKWNGWDLNIIIFSLPTISLDGVGATKNASWLRSWLPLPPSPFLLSIWLTTALSQTFY